MANDNHNSPRTNRAGFTLLEVMAVTLVSVIITMTALPNMINALGNMRLRSSMTSLAGVLQNCRILAVKENRAMTTHFVAKAYGSSFGVIAYVKPATDTSDLGKGDSQVQLEAPVSQVTTPSGPGAPSAITTSQLSFTAETSDPSFNPTGLPCAYSGGNCPNKGFVYYFHDTRLSGQMGWAALSISPAGRLKKWYWSGSAWTD